MKTLYLKDGTEIKRDGVDARDYVRAGLATYEKPVKEEIAINDVAVEESQTIVEEKVRRGRKPKGE